MVLNVYRSLWPSLSPTDRFTPGSGANQEGEKQLAQSLRAHFPAKNKKGLTPQQVCKFQNEIYWTEGMRACLHEIVTQLKTAAGHFLPRMDMPFWVPCESSGYANCVALEQKSCACPDDTECKCPLRPVAFFSRKLQGDPGKGQRGWHIRLKKTFAIVATLYKSRSWLAGQQVRVKVLTDHKSLETWTKEDFDTVSGPIGRRGRWHQFLARFQLDIIHVRGEDQTVPDVMSRWAYPAAHAARNVSIMGSQADVEGWEADDQEERSWADSQVARKIPPDFVRAYGAGTDSLPVCVLPENGCVCRQMSEIFLRFAGFTRKNRVSGRFSRVACGICNIGFLFPHAPTVVRNGSSGRCTKIMMSRTGRTRVWFLRTLVVQIHCGHPQTL